MAHCSSQLIHCDVKNGTTGFHGAVSFIYGHNEAGQRQALWEDLLQLSYSTSCPWILIGDFNVVMSQDERVSRVHFDQAENDAFVDCCESTGLSDARATGHFFTWSNKQQNGK